MSSVFLLIAMTVSTSCAPPSRPWLTEVLYDAVGDDTGHEFVELFNSSDAAYPLAGLHVEAGDGAGAGRWTLRWTGGAGDSIAARGRFVIGGAAVTPRPQALVTLDLQNGPDAVRLVWPDGASEVLGWGALAFPEYFCGAPATDAPSGESLARVPDDAALGSNALDFRPATPSPGRANVTALDVAIAPGRPRLSPPRPDPGESCVLAFTVENRGTSALPAGAVTLAADLLDPSGAIPLARATLDLAVAPGDAVATSLAFSAPEAGRHRLLVRVATAGDEVPENDADSMTVRVGPGPLMLTEIQFHPSAGEGEWVEVLNRSGMALDLSGWHLADRSGTRGEPTASGAILPADSLGLLAQDRVALLARFPALDAARVFAFAPWGSLNNSDGADGLADQVTLAEPDGTPSDVVAYSAAGIPMGATLEARDGGWWPSSLAGGTPLAPPPVLGALAGRFEVAPRRVRAASARARLAWALPWPRARLSVELFDLAGRSARRLAGELVVAARGAMDLDLAGLAPGLYALSLVAHAEGGAELLHDVRALRIAGNVP